MNNQKRIEIIADEKTAFIASAIKNSIEKNKHSAKGAINAVALSERSGIKNVGKVLERDAVSMRTILRILQALKELAKERNVDISGTIEVITRQIVS